MALHLQPGCEFLNELLICVGLSAANLVMEMGNRKHHAEFFPQADQDAKESDRISAARARNGNAITRLEQMLVADIVKHFLHRSGLRVASPL